MMGAMTVEAAALFAELQAAVLAEVERIGAEGFRRERVVAQFAGRVPRRTAYRWIGEILESGAPARHLEARAAAAVAARARSPDPAGDLARDVGRVLPPRPVDAVGSATAGRAGGRLAFMDILQQCLADAEQVRAYARTADGDVRSAKILLAASAHLRKTLETGAKIQETLASIAEMDRFHSEILAAVAEESPACAERIVMRLQQIAIAWGG